MFEALADDPDFECLIVDSTIIRACQHASGAKEGFKIRPSDVCAAGLTTKTHMAVRGLGCLACFSSRQGKPAMRTRFNRSSKDSQPKS